MLGRFRASPKSASPSIDAEATVRLAYRAVLHREPDPAGLAAYASGLRAGRDLAWLIDSLAQSSEFQVTEARAAQIANGPAATTQPAHELSNEPPMPVDFRCSEAELQGLWDHVARTWSRLGEEEPHWSVLTQEHFRAHALNEERLAAFYDSGRSEVDRLNFWLRRGCLTTRPGAVCAEFGCGVGRITQSLARHYARVVAFDVSAPHLATARARMQAERIQNVEFVHLTGKASLAALREIDVFYSVIALQHSPPPIILDVLEHAFAALRPGGYAFFQVPTFSTEYSYSAAEHLARLAHGSDADGLAPLEMEMHFVPQHKVLEIAHHAGLRTVEILPDTAVGDLDRWISSTFLLAR